MNFNLEQALDDFYYMVQWYGDDFNQYNYYVEYAVQIQINNPITYSAGYYQECIQKLKTAIGGYQMRMELE